MDTRVLEGVLEWARERPVWQQEAIRRLLNDDLDDDAISGLTDLCVAEQSDDESTNKSRQLPSPEEITTSVNPDAVVRLGAISAVANVNALASDQTLPFAQSCLTIVQGDNGSGKSGYARILKQVCRARSPQDVLPNAFDDVTGTPAANITFAVNETEQTTRWTGNGDLGELDALSAVSVYDSHATSIYIDKNHDLAYRPFGLDLYDRLVSICEKVKDEINQRTRAHNATKPNLDELTGEHEVGQLIAGLRAATPETDVDALAVWTNQDAENLRVARADRTQLQQTSPTQLAETKRAQATRSRQLAERLQAIGNQLSDETLAAYRQLRTDSASVREAADLAAAQIFEDAPLSGVGSDVWLRLWEAARAYSLEHPYPDQSFPVTDDQACCVLCQQRLEPSAAHRLRTFDEFVVGQLTTHAQQLEADRAAVEGAIGLLDLAISEPLLTEIEQAGGPASDNVRHAFVSAETRAIAALEEWDEVAELPELADSDLQAQLNHAADRLDETAQGLESTNGDIALSTATSRVDALEAQEKLAARRQDVVNAIGWHKANDTLEAAKAGISSYAITQRSRQVTEAVVSQGLLDSFADKLRSLGGGSLRVRLKSQARAGQLLHQLELLESPSGVPPGEVLSEGERSVVALAAFFAEVDLAPTPSPIVLDDPVTSLDHAYRERVVHHIFNEAQRRQVIVFTHDQVFVSELLDTFRNNDQSQMVAHYSVSRAVDTGLVTDGPPWQLLKVADRVKLLSARCDEGRDLWDANDPVAYNDHTKRTLGLLRETWERVVEEVVLDGTVQRFSRQVRTLRLPAVVKLTSEDVATIETGMALTSTQAHDQAAAAAQPIPTPDEVDQQVATLVAFCKEYRKR